MHIVHISSIAGEEEWYTGHGWYFTNEVFQFQGPFESEFLAVEAYAWHINAMFDRIIHMREAMASPNLIVPDKRLIQ